MHLKKCDVKNCKGYAAARSLCTKHYQRLLAHGDPTFLPIRVKYVKSSRRIRVKRECNVQGCSGLVDSLNLCLKHYTRQRNNGDVNIVKKVVGENRTKNPLYKSFHAMHDRCENPNNTHYEFYGGRGIKVCERWSGLSGFANFIEDMGERPKNFTLDRTDNSKGYSPENCRWASRKLQTENTRLSKLNKSGHKGISLFKKTNRWCASIYINGKKKHLGYFNSLDDAVEARKKAQLQTTTK